MTISNFTLIVTTTFTGLMAGLFFSYSFSVVAGLGKLPDIQYLMAMQSINREIQNPVFFICFFGALISLPVCTYFQYSVASSLVFRLVLLAAIIYLVGSFAVTAIGNIPLNNALDKFDVATAAKEAISAQRTAFESRWNNLNTLRTVASILSFILLVTACLYHSGNAVSK
jgi:uncharacterized membrane protein